MSGQDIMNNNLTPVRPIPRAESSVKRSRRHSSSSSGSGIHSAKRLDFDGLGSSSDNEDMISPIRMEQGKKDREEDRENRKPKEQFARPLPFPASTPVRTSSHPRLLRMTSSPPTKEVRAMKLFDSRRIPASPKTTVVRKSR